MPKEKAELIAEHYQKTFELTLENWKERNRLFVFLVLTSGIGLLLLLQVPEASSLLVDFIVKLLEITDKERIKQLHESFPIDVILSITFVIVFYLMQKLYSTNLAVSRNYRYLNAVEHEIRNTLGMPEKSISFTREGSFYWNQRTWGQEMSKWYFILVISIVLLPFIFLKIQSDLEVQNHLITSIDIVVSIITLLFFLEYARSAINLDVEKNKNDVEVPPDTDKEISSSAN